jgi:ATP-dependent Clp protease ATP-binding subunit ClpA
MSDYTADALRVIPFAQAEAHRLGFPFVQREQLFLGLLKDPTVSRILTAIGIDLDNVRLEIEARLVPGLGAPDDPVAIGVLPTAEQVYRQRAQAATALTGSMQIGSEHILLGFFLEQHGTVLEVLNSLGATKLVVMEQIRQIHM